MKRRSGLIWRVLWLTSGFIFIAGAAAENYSRTVKRLSIDCQTHLCAQDIQLEPIASDVSGLKGRWGLVNRPLQDNLFHPE